MAERLWAPSRERADASQLAAFIARVRERAGLRGDTYEELHAWSIRDPRAFWAELWDFVGIVCSVGYGEVVDDPARLPGARWFSGARLNFAENLLRHRDARTALLFQPESGAARSLSYAELAEQVARAAAGLRALGVGKGDRVAALLPNQPETVIAMLAAASLGAIFSSCSPDFGAPGILDRFGQIAPAVLIGIEGYAYAGRWHGCLDVLAEVTSKLPSLRRLVVVPREPAADAPSQALPPGAMAWARLLGAGDAPPLRFEQLPFDHPVYILYSSGTTGVPKCIVHGAGGTLIQHLKEHVLHTDLRRDDRIFYFTTCGWMMWNWLVSALAVGATVVLYDGSPFHPDGRVLFDLAERERVTVFGTSARFLAAAEKAGVQPARSCDLSALRTILSTGSPLPPEGFRYVYRDVKRDVQLASISGGTDIVSCFFTGNPLAPVHAGELQCRGLGMKVEAYDDRGHPLIGARGELVCTLAAPCFPLGFWNDPDGARYRAAYFERFPGVWHHGDFVEITPTGSAIVYGRSDATLNPGGVRIGTAEIYRQVETLPEIADSIAIAQEEQGDVRVVLFVKLRPGRDLDADLARRIRERIRAGTTPRHVPARICAVDDIPYTRSGKKVELAVRELVHGRPVRNREALANPECLAQFPERLAAAL
jgi:acetoacetyl-CoA synthetase